MKNHITYTVIYKKINFVLSCIEIAVFEHFFKDIGIANYKSVHIIIISALNTTLNLSLIHISEPTRL
ncbi:hypothetical protein, partial [Methanosarcina sp. 2.H.T.1A.3]|uniref:hypothetical protein n=1 Tax=Methanosarcina sp. 2.H.T.1A.3 TaxID=1483597 RepID=UPI001F2AF702